MFWLEDANSSGYILYNLVSVANIVWCQHSLVSHLQLSPEAAGWHALLYGWSWHNLDFLKAVIQRPVGSFSPLLLLKFLDLESILEMWIPLCTRGSSHQLVLVDHQSRAHMRVGEVQLWQGKLNLSHLRELAMLLPRGENPLDRLHWVGSIAESHSNTVRSVAVMHSYILLILDWVTGGHPKDISSPSLCHCITLSFQSFLCTLTSNTYLYIRKSILRVIGLPICIIIYYIYMYS